MFMFFALVGVFVVSWILFWGILALWDLFTGQEVRPIIDNSSIKRRKK